MALIPPVSGGDFRLTAEPLSLDAVVARGARDEAGAIATFVGTVRNRSRDRTVLYLEYEAYEGMAEEVMAELARELAERHELSAVAIHHRVGRVEIGEPSVVIAVSVAAPRRRARRLQGGDRHAQGDGAALEEGGLRGRRGVDRPGLMSRAIEPIRTAPEADDRATTRRSGSQHEPITADHGADVGATLLRKLWAPIAALGLLLWKFKFVFVAIFKFKFFTVAGSMFVSIGAYALLWGWQFAIGFVLLLLVHELGHVLEAKRQGLPVSAPIFIPFLGALITLKQLPDDAWRRRKLAIAGPILGGLGAAAVWGLGECYDSRPARSRSPSSASSSTSSTWLRSSPLDGGRIVAAIHPALWLVGLVGLARARRSWRRTRS